MGQVHFKLVGLVALVATGGMLAACESAPKVVTAPPFYVPTAAIRQPLRGMAGPRQVAYERAGDVLPGWEAEALYAPRGEPVAYGSTQMGGISAYTDYTYDAERISTPGNSGWRYRYVVRQGVSIP